MSGWARRPWRRREPEAPVQSLPPPVVPARRTDPAVDLSDIHVRQRLLAEGPVGEWHSRPGTATALMCDEIRFSSDGTGEAYSDSLLGGEHVKLSP